jgi:hypothetical protein
MSTDKMTYLELTDFAKNIVDEMTKILGSENEALSIFNHYYGVYEKIYGNDMESPRFYAQKFTKANINGPTPEEWLEHIRKYEDDDQAPAPEAIIKT